MGVVADDFTKTETRCVHCGEPCPRGSKFCKFSASSAQRDEMDQANRDIFEKAGLTFKAPIIK